MVTSGESQELAIAKINRDNEIWINIVYSTSPRRDHRQHIYKLVQLKINEAK